MVKIKAAVVEQAGGKFGIRDLILDEPRSDEILVRIVAAGVCHTDMVLRDMAQAPSVFGHEGAGIVEAIGNAVNGVAPGDKVLLSFDSCKKCNNCRNGMPAYCFEFNFYNMAGIRKDGSHQLRDEDGAPVNGSFFGQSSFATHALATERNVVVLPDEIPEDLLPVLAPLGCGIQTGAGAVMNSLKVRAADSVVVFGAGGVGLSAVMAANVSGASRIVVVDLNESRLQLAKELGATHTFNGADADLVERIKEATNGGANFAVETTGNKNIVRISSEVLLPGGTTGIIGVGGGDISFDHAQIIGGVRVMGILEGDAVPQTFIPKLIELYRSGKLPIDKMVTRYPFEQIQQAVEDSERGTSIKGVLVFD